MTNQAHNRVYNFSAGPSMLPLEVLEEAHSNFLNHEGTGMNVMEMSHRSKPYMKIIGEARDNMRSVLNVPDNYEILFLQGGASQMFATIPLNLLGDKKKAAYALTGTWSKKAIDEAKRYCDVQIVMNTTDNKHTTILPQSSLNIDPEAAYFHYCYNETIHGVCFDYVPETPEGVPLICDMSSNIFERPIDVSKFGMIYGGAQKNCSMAGVTFCIVRKDLIGKSEHPLCPTMLKLSIHAKNESMYNTPTTYGVYLAGLVFKWLQKKGGLEEMYKINVEKANYLYEIIDSSDFYHGPVEKEFRSLMNVPFRVGPNGGDADLEKKFLAEAAQVGLVTLAGHRSLGGCRASIYNGMPIEGCQALADFMKKFEAENK
ncbi:hypothetical protein GEMRC1_008578 [Eukaryota sp. GEM-RC1]